MSKNKPLMPRVTDVNDITKLIKDVEYIFREYELGTPMLALIFMLPPSYKKVHWSSNIKAKEMITLVEQSLENMKEQLL